MNLIVAVCLILNLFFENGKGHSYNLGDCPAVEPMQDFDMNRMLGIWYAVQKTSTASSCVIYNFTRTNEPYEYDLEQYSQHFAIGLTPLKHEYKYTGKLHVPDKAVPAKMFAKFPLNFLGSASYVVFATDYDTFAGIFTCQKLAFARRESATILSRRRTLDKMYIDKIRSKLSSYGVDPFELSPISQENCPKNLTEGVNINIDDDTFSAHSIANTFRKAGEKIGDGFEYVANGAKKVFGKGSNNSGEKEDFINQNVQNYPMTPNPHAEWLP
ncbi:apolipoprotein D isoform X2 [Agrilus planipennis]|uniref:Apolipoprotein D isoform X1 n=1 Tax=Agrilus planipennis TaxID=224129 RepID=A0A7F5RMU8_AGRPL|nr:apolipoprotein D isoform X1 [Agrilus planipennis]XP_025837349.1 apolipoprotein D isoform X2 [Agrilus planipennis]